MSVCRTPLRVTGLGSIHVALIAAPSRAVFYLSNLRGIYAVIFLSDGASITTDWLPIAVRSLSWRGYQCPITTIIITRCLIRTAPCGKNHP